MIISVLGQFRLDDVFLNFENTKLFHSR